MIIGVNIRYSTYEYYKDIIENIKNESDTSN